MNYILKIMSINQSFTKKAILIINECFREKFIFHKQKYFWLIIVYSIVIS